MSAVWVEIPWSGVIEQMATTPITHTLVDGCIITESVPQVIFYHYSLPYLKCFPLLSILTLHTAIPMLVMSVFGLIALQEVKTTVSQEEHYYTTLSITAFGVLV